MEHILTIVVATFIFRLTNGNYADIEYINLIIKGDLPGKIDTLDNDVLLYNLQFLQNTEIQGFRKRLVFAKIKGNRTLQEMTLYELKKIGTFLGGINSYDLWDDFDCKYLEHVYILGRAKLSYRYLAILADCLITKFGTEVYNNYLFINKMTSILCGFGVENLKKISRDHFLLINGEVFFSLDTCTRHQLKALYDLAIGPNVYGPPYSWDLSVLKTLGRLLIVASLKEIYEIQPSRFRGILPRVVRELDPKIIKLLNDLNLYLDLTTKRKVWEIVGLSYRSVFEDARSTAD